MENEKDINAIPCKEFRQRALRKLAGNTKRAALFSLLYAVIVFAIALLIDEETWGIEYNDGMRLMSYIIIVAVFYIAFYLVITPFSVGYAKFHLQMSRGIREKFSVMFFGFKKYIRNTITFTIIDLVYYGFLFVGGAFTVIICFALIMFMGGIESSEIQNSIIKTLVSSAKWGICFGIVFVVMAYIFYKLFALIEFTPFILADNSELGAIKVFKLSWKGFSPYNLKMIKLWFSFIGWWLLGIVTLGIALLWVYPYWMLAKAELYKDIFNEGQTQEVETQEVEVQGV